MIQNDHFRERSIIGINEYQINQDNNLTADNIERNSNSYYCHLFSVVFMRNKRKLKHRRREERRKTPHRRNGYDRRTIAGNEFGDNNVIFNTLEACLYLKISRPTYLKYITNGKIKAQKIGRGWKVFKEELDRFIRGE